MAVFYGGVWGNRGEATRQGNRDGLRAYAQSYSSRITVDYGYHTPDGEKERVIAHVTLGPGWTSGYRSHTFTLHPDTVAEALDTGDEKMQGAWKQLLKAVERLDNEAPKAIKRAARRRKAAA